MLRQRFISVGSKRNVMSSSDHCVCPSPRYTLDQSEPSKVKIDQLKPSKVKIDQSELGTFDDLSEEEPSTYQGVLSMLEDMKMNLDNQLQKSEYRKFYSLSPFRNSGNIYTYNSL